MRVLAVDTSGPVIGAGLAWDERVVIRTERVTRGAEARLAHWFATLCDEVGGQLSELDGVAVATGPGAFTGLRVGMAAAMGVAHAVGCPIWGACSLEHRAAAASIGELPVLSMLDARKSRVYAALYDAEGRCIRGPDDVPPAEALSWCISGFIATGEGAVVYREQATAAGGRMHEAASDPQIISLLKHSEAAFMRGEGLSPFELRPTYLREPDAKPPAQVSKRP